MSVAPSSAGVERIVRRPFSPATALVVLAWLETDGCHRLRARHSGKCADDGGASTTDLAPLGQRTGTATGFPWSRVRRPASTPSRRP
ncbi:hypothetical protein ABZ499_04785 [Streptomyces sp. NPDC019990]|uniref:RICIN domain-containing protein n=1 Tax=Streptomyces sp. NPDC019990 TaxID=3154693 RepID=UPI0033CFA7D1